MPPLPFLSIESCTGAVACLRLVPQTVPSLLHHGGTVGSLGMLEAVLSADNAVALAGIVAGVQPAERRSRILNQGLLCAFLLRGVMIVAAAWVIRFDAVRVLGGMYLVWLALRHFQQQFEEPPQDEATAASPHRSTLSLLGVIACTDLAFSIDSVSAAVAVSDNLILVLIGGALGVGMLRFLAGWVIVWMDRYMNLAHAAYLTVLAVGLRMLARTLAPALDPPQGAVLLMMALLFVWGFSRSREPLPAHAVGLPTQAAALEVEATSSSGSGVCSTPALTRANTARL